MDIQIPIMIQDLQTAVQKGIPPVQNIILKGEDFFLDGPVSRSVAVLDFEPESGLLRPGVTFRPTPGARYGGSYTIPTPGNFTSPEFMQVSAFGTVLATVKMFEEKDNLGRKLVWAFDGPQLLVVPRAGEWANAFYERESRSLQLFYFPSRVESNKTVYTSLSHDIIAHETGHAILDSIARDLYNCLTPQSLALHEAVADLTALVMAFQMDSLVDAVLAETGGSIDDATAFSSIAEEFGAANEYRAGYLRSLLNRKTLDANDTSLDENGKPNFVGRSDPHALSEVLSGALYRVLLRLYEERRRFVQPPRKALFEVVEQIKRMVFRALDYLPPGEVSFADYGRAIIAADRAAHPAANRVRRWIEEEFVRRRIVQHPEELRTRTSFTYPPLEKVNLATLASSDWAAYEFANRHRRFLRIPAGENIYVRPRQDVTKRYYHRDGQVADVRELIFKVSWDNIESLPLGPGVPDHRQVTVGTTLAIDWETRKVRALLTSDFTNQKEERDRMLKQLLDSGLLVVVGREAEEEHTGSRPRPRAEVIENLLRVRGTARLLHIVPEVEYD